MSRVSGLRTALLAGAFVTAAALAGCGKQGVLEQPPPLFGAKAKAEYQARRAAAQQPNNTSTQAPAPAPAQGSGGGGGGGAASNAQGPGGTGSDNAPLTTRDIQDPSQKQTPASSAPIIGAPPPISGPPQTRPSF